MNDNSELLSKSISRVGKIAPDNDGFSHVEHIKLEFERIRFSTPFMVYQRMGQWWMIDYITLNFHLISATVTIYLCTNYQVSVFMSFYLICTVVLCIRAARQLQINGSKV
jgi:hypothetical protein